jgi:hypothetical protein
MTAMTFPVFIFAGSCLHANQRKPFNAHQKADVCQEIEKGKENLGKPKKTNMAVRSPGIEPGSLPWQGSILPLDHERRASEHGRAREITGPIFPSRHRFTKVVNQMDQWAV